MTELRDVKKEYLDGSRVLEVLEGVDLSVETGEFVVVYGRSGAGKSTLLNVLGLLDEPTSGEVVVAGREASGLSGEERSELRLREIGFVFQDYNLFPSLTAEENVALPVEVAGGRAEERARELLGRFGLEGLSGRRPSELSGGERQRVGVLRALANEPSLLLADEPTSSVDEETEREVLDFIAEVNEEEGVSVVLTTNRPGKVSGVDSSYELSGGVLRAS